MWVILLVFATFLIGNCIAFGEKLSSFQRYTSSLLICMLTFIIQDAIQKILQLCTEKFEKIKANGKRWIAIGYLLLFAFCNYALVDMTCNGLSSWNDHILELSEDEQWMKDYGVYQIKENELKLDGEGSNYYLLIVSPHTDTYARVHHRIYFELLDTTARIGNYYKDTNIVDGGMIDQLWFYADVEQAAENWVSKLRDGGYDYVYVVRTNAFADEVMTLLGAEHTEAGTILAIHTENGNVNLESCNSN